MRLFTLGTNNIDLIMGATANSGKPRCCNKARRKTPGTKAGHSHCIRTDQSPARSRYDPSAFFFPNVFLMLSNSSILAPFLRMMKACWITDSVLFHAQ